MSISSKQNKKQIAVLGLGRFGAEIAKSLYNNGSEVLAVDADEERVATLEGYATNTAVADISDEAVLKQLAISSFDTVIVAIGDDMQSSIICSFICKELGCNHIIAKARDDKHAKILEKIGVDEVIIPEADSARKTATKLLNPQIHDLMELANGYSVAEFEIPKNWGGKSLATLMLPSKYSVNVLIVLENNEFKLPTADTVLNENDKIVAGGRTKDLSRLADALNKMS